MGKGKGKGKNKKKVPLTALPTGMTMAATFESPEQTKLLRHNLSGNEAVEGEKILPSEKQGGPQSLIPASQEKHVGAKIKEGEIALKISFLENRCLLFEECLKKGEDVLKDYMELLKEEKDNLMAVFAGIGQKCARLEQNLEMKRIDFTFLEKEKIEMEEIFEMKAGELKLQMIEFSKNFSRLEKLMMEMEKNLELKAGVLTLQITESLTPFTKEMESIKLSMGSRDGKMGNLEMFAMDLAELKKKIDMGMENNCELKAMEVNLEVNTLMISFMHQVEDQRLSMEKNFESKVRELNHQMNESFRKLKMEMEKPLWLKAEDLPLQITMSLQPYDKELDDMKLKLESRDVKMENLNNDYIQLKMMMMEMKKKFEMKHKDLNFEVQSRESKIEDLERSVSGFEKEKIAMEKSFDLHIGELNLKLNDCMKLLTHELNAFKLSLKKGEDKIEDCYKRHMDLSHFDNVKIEMEKSFEQKVEEMNEFLKPFLNELDTMKLSLRNREAKMEELKAGIEIVQSHIAETQKKKKMDGVRSWLVPAVSAIFAAVWFTYAIKTAGGKVKYGI